MLGHREEFDKFVKNFVEKRKAWSKVLTRSRGDHIVACLKGAATDAQFKFWVKSRGFRVMDYSALGLRKVLSNFLMHVNYYGNNIVFLSPQQQQESEQLVSFLLRHNTQVKAVVEDGNCFFRCLSHILYGHEDNHYEVRSLMVRFDNLNQERFKGLYTDACQ